MSDPRTYTVGWICAVEKEYVAAQEFLDEDHPPLSYQNTNDNNIYKLGKIGRHNVVVACLSHCNNGLTSAANVARDMLQTFTNLRFGLMVGIGGGVPTFHDIRLGDIVVSSVDYANGAVFQYDFGRTTQDEAFQATRYHDAPPLLLQAAVQRLKAKYQRLGNSIGEAIEAVLVRNPRLKQEFQRPSLASDRLYRSNFVHKGTSDGDCASSCGDSDENLVTRNPRGEFEDSPKVHYGLIASGNQVIQDAQLRDKLAREKGVLCFEMEAAGLMNHFKCLVIRGICDYSDSHRNKEWQGYAAIAAAAYAKDILDNITPRAKQYKVPILDEIQMMFTEVDRPRKDISTTVDYTWKRHYVKANSWLSPPDPSINLRQALQQRFQGTGQWLLHSDAYIAWKRESKSFMYLHGIPGCGKTILSATVVDDLDKSHSPNLLYFFFDHSDDEKRSYEKAVRSFICQLYRQRDDCRAEVDSLYSSYGDGERQPDQASLLALLQNLIHKAGEVWIVLDALDENQTSRESWTENLIPWIESLRQSQSITHILVTSRPEADIEFYIEDWVSHREFNIDVGYLAHEDIHLYVEARVTQLEMWKERPDIQKEIKDVFFDLTPDPSRLVCRPTFRWIAYRLDTLEECRSPVDVREALQDALDVLALDEMDELSQREETTSVTSFDSVPSLTAGTTLTSGLSYLGALQFAELLFNDETVHQLIRSAQDNDNIKPEKIKRNFIRLLKRLSVGLKDEANGEPQKVAARIAKKQAGQICDHVLQYVRDGHIGGGKTLSLPADRKDPKENIEKYLDSISSPSQLLDRSAVLGNTDEAQALIYEGSKGFEGYEGYEGSEGSEGSVGSVGSGATEVPNLTKVMEFISSSTAFSVLKTDLKAFIAGADKKTEEVNTQTNPKHPENPEPEVESGQPRDVATLLGSPILARLWYSLWKILDPPPKGAQRVAYTCGCGDLRYLDVEELEPGGVDELRKMLDSAASAVREHNPNRGVPASSLPEAPQQAHMASSHRRQKSQQGPAQNLPGSGSIEHGTNVTSHESPPTPSQTTEPKYLLLCVNTKRSLTIMRHLEVSSLSNDQYLFQNINQEYHAIRKHDVWNLGMLIPESISVPEWILRLMAKETPISRKLPEWVLSLLENSKVFIPKTAEFAQFELMPIHKEICAGNLAKPEIPSEEEVRKKTYEYSPIPLRVRFLSIPYLHELLRPGEHLGRFWWNRLPKKLGGMLAWQEDRQCIGWGIHINEGWNTKFIVLSAFILLLSFGAFVLIYSIITSDGSTGAGVGSFLVATLTFYSWLKYETWKSG